jgi:hypothetical protein
VLTNIVQLVQDLQKVSKSKNEPAQEYISRYLKDHVFSLWPEGWIRIEDFAKELEKKRKKDAKAASTSSSTTSQGNADAATATNGKLSAGVPTVTTLNAQRTPSTQKTEARSKSVGESCDLTPIVNGKTSAKQQQLTAAALLASQAQSVIKKASDHSINSIMSTSPSPPSHSSNRSVTPVLLTDSKTRVIDLEKLTSPSDILKVSQKDIIRKYPTDIVIEKHRISDGSDSDCAIVDSPMKSTPSTVKPQQQQFSHHTNNNKVNHSSSQQTQQQQQQQPPSVEIKKAKKADVNYSNLIEGICSLTVS